LSYVVAANPLTYGVAGLRRILYGDALPATSTLPSFDTCLMVTVAFAAVCLGLSVLLTHRRSARDAR
jgi:hypothetical protein